MAAHETRPAEVRVLPRQLSEVFTYSSLLLIQRDKGGDDGIRAVDAAVVGGDEAGDGGGDAGVGDGFV